MKTMPGSEFCMKQFRAAIAALVVSTVAVVAWTGWHCTSRQNQRFGMALAAATAPKAPPIRVKDKMLHPYWGNCSQCHVTVDPPGRPISKVMAGAPISIMDKTPHEYWGNCLLCHEVTDGLRPGERRTLTAKAAAMNRITSRTVGMELQTVTGTMMRSLGLANEDGVLVLEVQPGSIAAQAGFEKGDEITRVGKVRVESVGGFESALAELKPGSQGKVTIYRGKKTRNLFVKLPGKLVTAAATAPMTQNQVETLAEQFGVPKTEQAVTQALQGQNQGLIRAAATAPMTQNQVETLAEQLGVPKTEQAVTQALQGQSQGQLVAANSYFGKVAVASMGPGLNYPVCSQFGSSPYFVIFDPVQKSQRAVASPNYHDATGRDIQSGQYMLDLGVSNVIAGDFNQDAISTLHTLRLNAYSGVTGSVKNALAAYMAGQLQPMNTNLRAGVGIPGGRYPTTGRDGGKAQAMF